MKKIKKVTVEYEDGIEEVFSGPGHLTRNDTYRVEEHLVDGKTQKTQIPVKQVWVTVNVG